MVVWAGVAPLISLPGRRPDTLGTRDGRLADCPASPNCVCSDATDEGHRVAPLAFTTEPERAWRALRESVLALPRTEIVTEADGYLHAECHTWLLGFVDDLEFQLHTKERVIAVRSASRLGYSDLGANRRRVEGLRQALRRRGVVR